MFPFGPLLIPIIILIVEIIYKAMSEKDKPVQEDKTIFSDIIKKFEEGFNELLNDEEEVVIPKEKDAALCRDLRVENQRAKVETFSDYDRNVLRRDENLKKKSLISERKPLKSDIFNTVDDYDLDVQKSSNIKSESSTIENSKSFNLNIKDDLLKGFIFSEIFDKPKSLR